MKVTVSFKTPDAVDDALSQEFDYYLNKDNIDELEREKILEEKSKMEKFISKFVEYGEYVRIEFDSDNKTATVIPND